VKELVWITHRDAITLHDRLLGLHGGPAGIRDEKLMESALARPHQHLAYADSPDVVTLSAIYTAGIVRNHPFVDGNKRTGFLVGILFLELNGYRFVATEEDAANAVLGLAAGTLNEAAYAAFLGQNSKRAKS
jgi:death-on-curing protein